jgi:hypothetical protein
VIENDDIGILLPTEYPRVTDLDSRLLDRLAYIPRDYRLTAPLADAMIAFADNRAAWAEAGRRGRRKLYARYDLRDTIRAYEAVMADVAAP